MSKLDKVDRAVNTFGRILSLAITIACIIVSGIVAHFILKAMDYDDVLLWGGTIIFALAGGVLVKIILRLMVWMDWG